MFQQNGQRIFIILLKIENFLSLKMEFNEFDCCDLSILSEKIIRKNARHISHIIKIYSNLSKEEIATLKYEDFPCYYGIIYCANILKKDINTHSNIFAKKYSVDIEPLLNHIKNFLNIQKLDSNIIKSAPLSPRN